MAFTQSKFTALAHGSIEPVRDDCAVDSSLYWASLDESPTCKTLRARISSVLARKIPLHARPLRNDAPMVSFTFDDAPETAHTIGARLLQEAKARGTFYISTALLGRRTEHWPVIGPDGVRDLHRLGHEIGLHGHAHLPVGERGALQLADDIARNRASLNAIDPTITAENFAYPYGQVSFWRKMQLAGLVRSSRGIARGVNRQFIDAQFIRSVELADQRLGHEDLDRYLDRAVATRGWLVFSSHDVGDRPSPFGVTKGLLSRALEGSLRRGLKIVTVSEALTAAKVRCGEAPCEV